MSSKLKIDHSTRKTQNCKSLFASKIHEQVEYPDDAKTKTDRTSSGHSRVQKIELGKIDFRNRGRKYEILAPQTRYDGHKSTDAVTGTWNVLEIRCTF